MQRARARACGVSGGDQCAASCAVVCAACRAAQMGVLESAPLVRALFECYLGADPVAPAAKVEFGQRLAEAVATK